MKPELFKYFAIFTLCAVLFTACETTDDDDDPADDNDVTAVVDNVQSESAVSSTFSTVNHYGITEEGIKDLQGEVTVTVTPCVFCEDFPKTLTIDFGTGVLGTDSIVRKGKIIAVFSDHWDPAVIVPNTNVEISFDAYKENGVTRSGQITATYVDTNSAGGPILSIFAQDLKLSFTNGDEASITGTRTFSWIEGSGNLVQDDDVIEITGDVTGVSTDGSTYSSNILEGYPLRTQKSCAYGFVSGKVEITPEGKNARTLNFGDGECDGQLVVDILGTEITVDFGL